MEQNMEARCLMDNLRIDWQDNSAGVNVPYLEFENDVEVIKNEVIRVFSYDFRMCNLKFNGKLISVFALNVTQEDKFSGIELRFYEHSEDKMTKFADMFVNYGGLAS